LAEEINKANLKNLTCEDSFYHLMLKEYNLQLESGNKNRIRFPGFSYRKYLKDLLVCDLQTDAQRRLKVLKAWILSDMDKGLAGNP